MHLRLTNAVQFALSPNKSAEEGHMHWTKDPANKAKLARAAAKRARTRKKRGRRAIAKSVDAVRYGAKSNVNGVIRDELREAEKRVKALRAILRGYQALR
jgi:hypothetical protein